MVAEAGCGAIACALGFAAQHPDFVAEGLQLKHDSDGFEPSCVRASSVSERPVVVTGYVAAAEFFGLPYMDAFELFCDQGLGKELSDKEQFLRRLRHLLHTGSMRDYSPGPPGFQGLQL